MTAYNGETGQPVIGFDMGGMSKLHFAIDNHVQFGI